MSQNTSPKHRVLFIKDKDFEATGALHHEMGLTLLDCPDFLFPRHILAWQKGWMRASAFHEGFNARDEGKTLSENPHIKSSTKQPTGIGLAGQWKKGFLACYTALNQK